MFYLKDTGYRFRNVTARFGIQVSQGIPYIMQHSAEFRIPFKRCFPSAGAMQILDMFDSRVSPFYIHHRQVSLDAASGFNRRPLRSLRGCSGTARGAHCQRETNYRHQHPYDARQAAPIIRQEIHVSSAS